MTAKSVDTILGNTEGGLSLDVDGTLADSVRSWTEAMIQRFGNPEKLSAAEIIARYQYVQDYWKAPDAMAWIEHQRESSELYAQTKPIPGAVHYIGLINRIVPVREYVTTRYQRFIDETREWLLQARFPRVGVIAMPDNTPYDQGNAWKASVLVALYPYVRYHADDNQGLIKHLPDWYKGTIILFGHDTAPQAKIHVVPCKDWKRTYEWFKENITLSSSLSS